MPSRQGIHEQIRFARRTYHVRDRWRVAGKDLLILNDLTGKRQRFLAYDRFAKPGGDLRIIYCIEGAQGASVRTLISVLERNRDAPQIVYYDRAGSTYRLVVPFVHGPTLTEVMEAGRLAPIRSFQLFRRLAHCLAAAHRRDVHHGDIKPDNLIVQQDRLVPIDFGSAWLTEHSRAHRHASTPPYAAPEQLPELREDGGVPSWQCDQFSASVVLYQMLTTEIPYGGCGGTAALPAYSEAAQRFVVPSDHPRADKGGLPRSVWQSVDAIVKTSLNLPPEGRYSTTGEWLDAIDEVDQFLRRKNWLSPVNRLALRILNRLS